MPNRTFFSFNEEEDAEQIILNGFAGKSIDYTKMYIMAKYFRSKFGYGAIRLEKELIKFCKEHDKNFNPIVEAEMIKKWVKVGINYKLRKTESIPISKNEIEFLKSIDNVRDRKLLYVTLLLAKVLKNNEKENAHHHIWYSNFADIVHLCELTNVKETEIADLFFKYKDHFIFYSPEKELIRLTYADTDSENVFVIENPKRLMEYYELIFGGKNECSVCGKSFTRTSPRQRMCKDCAKELRKEKVRKNVAEYRKRNSEVNSM